MFKVLIIDDEAIIAKGLQTKMDWKRLGCTVCGVAGDGLEGRRLLDELEPDIVISDIVMPGLTGLELADYIFSRHPSVITIILTAYLLAGGVMRIMLSFGYRAQIPDAWAWVLFSGVVDILLALIIMSGMPGTAAWVLGLLVGINLLMMGTSIVAGVLVAATIVFATGALAFTPRYALAIGAIYEALLRGEPLPALTPA